MKKSKCPTNLTCLALLAILEGFFVIVSFLIIPSDPKNSVFLGYSMERWIMIGAIVIFQLIHAFVLFKNKVKKWTDRFDRLLSSKWLFLSFVAILLSLAGISGFLLTNPELVNTARLLRLSPIIVYCILLLLQTTIFQLIKYDEIQQLVKKVDSWSNTNLLFWVAMVASFPLLFLNAIKHDIPLGFAGLYTMMSENIARANFSLPVSVPIYGNGGLPFSYPPFGLYLMGLFLKIGVDKWDYLRFAPPIFSLIAFIPMFFFVKRISNSTIAGFAAVLFVAGSFDIYFMQSESGGIVRGLAYALGFASIYFYDRMITSYRWRDAIFSGVFFGLTGLTHLGYAYFFAFWLFVWTIFHLQKKTLSRVAVMSSAFIMVTIPWVSVMLHRYGFSVFTNAFQSHNTTEFLSFFRQPNTILPAILNNLHIIIEKPWLLILVFIGLITSIIKKEFKLPVLFILIATITFQGDRFILTVCFVLAGAAIARVFQFIYSRNILKNVPLQHFLTFIVLFAIFIPAYSRPFLLLTKQKPLVTQEMVDAANFMKENTSTDSKYLYLVTNDSQEDEWFPYLSQRDAILGYWGSEWNGTLDIINGQLNDLMNCTQAQSLTCMETWFSSTHISPEYVVMPLQLQDLAISFESSSEWEQVYKNPSYLIWNHK